jgi:prolyl oligopeptidase
MHTSLQVPRSDGRTTFLALLALAATACSSSTTTLAGRNTGAGPRVAYPAAPRGDIVDEHHGVRVADPYRWLEDADSAATRAWIDGQNEVTRGVLESVEEHPAIVKRLTELWDYERYGLPEYHGQRWFVTRNDGLQNQAVLYKLDSLGGEMSVLLDPNTLSADGTLALAGAEFSVDGRYLAYGISDGGSDWTVWRVREVESGRDLEDELRWVKFARPQWAPDSKGLYYSRYDEPAAGAELAGVNFNQKLCFHALGTKQSDDPVVLARPDHKEWSFNPTVSEDGRWLVISVGRGTDPKNLVFVREVGAPDAPFVELVSEFVGSFEFCASHQTRLYFVTDLDAPRGRLVSVDMATPGPATWTTLVPQSEDKLDGADLVGLQFFCRYTKDARSAVKVHREDGAFVRDVELPGVGAAAGFEGRWRDPLTFYSFASFRQPPTIYMYDVATAESRVWRAPKLAFDPELFATEQVFYSSKDGARVPMFLTYKKGLERNGANPTLLYGYGGFNVTLSPNFRASRIAWLERGGVYAQANLRGGGEYGEEWHQAGAKLRKQNVFDDFIGAAEYLVREKWTSPSKLAINGGSNGGLLVGAVLNQRPDLFGAAIPVVGVMDMLRFELFTIGWAWTSDYGSVKNADEFGALYAYSPYHNVKLGAHYPATLVVTADRDDRVVPAHSFKYAAALQHAQGGPAPILIRIETRAGHGAGKPTTKQIEQAADEMAFLIYALR